MRMGSILHVILCLGFVIFVLVIIAAAFIFIAYQNSKCTMEVIATCIGSEECEPVVRESGSRHPDGYGNWTQSTFRPVFVFNNNGIECRTTSSRVWNNRKQLDETFVSGVQYRIWVDPANPNRCRLGWVSEDLKWTQT